MNLQITSDNIEISDSMIELAKIKVSKLDRYFEAVDEDLRQLRIVMNSGPGESMFSVKVELNFGGLELVGKTEDYSLETSVIGAVEDLERQYLREKDKKESKEWNEAREMKRFPIE